MAGKQRTRIHALTDSGAVSTNHDNIGTVDETTSVNAHGLRVNFSVEPENADANANGTWALWCLPRTTTAIPSTSIGGLELEGDNPALWACGVWTASNQTPYNLPDTALGTSRNCPIGTRIVLRVFRQGVSAGNVRVISIIRYFNTSL